MDTPLLSGSSSRVFVAVQEMAGPRHGDHGERQHGDKNLSTVIKTINLSLYSVRSKLVIFYLSKSGCI